MIPIHDVSRLTGIQAGTLRVWEQRYGWPTPQRGANNYRMYTRHQLHDIKRVKALLDTGTTIGELIIDGEVRFPTVLIDKPAKPVIDLTAIPPPRTSVAQRLRQRLEIALRTGAEGVIAECVAMLPTIHPADRGPAVSDVLAAVGRRLP